MAVYCAGAAVGLSGVRLAFDSVDSGKPTALCALTTAQRLSKGRSLSRAGCFGAGTLVLSCLGTQTQPRGSQACVLVLHLAL